MTALALRGSPFWRRNPELWFVHLEAQFQISGITVGATKFNYAIVGLDEESILLVADIVKSASYTLLKTAFIKRRSVSESAKLDHLLADLRLGDRTPSQLVGELRQLGGSKIDDDLLKPLWLRGPPEGTQAVLACVSGSLEALAAATNMVHELHARPTIAAVQQPSDEVGEINALVASMAEMRATLDAKRSGGRSRARSQSTARKGRSGSRSSGQPTDRSICWYQM